MTNPITLTGFRSFLKVMKKDGIDPKELAQILIDELGIYMASEIATEIEKAEQTIPENE